MVFSEYESIEQVQKEYNIKYRIGKRNLLN